MATSRNSILIVSHVLVYGAAHALRDYLLTHRYAAVAFLTHPLTEDIRVSELTHYTNGKKTGSQSHRRSSDGSAFSYIVSFLLTLQWVLRDELRYDVFIGVNNLNCCAGILLRTLGYTKRVVYYSIDFTPERFSNGIMNYLYHALELFCVKHADVVWNTSARIAEGRHDYLHISQKQYPQYVVPIGVWYDQIRPVRMTEKNRYRALFMGHILEKQGLQKIVDALPAIIKKIPQFSLHVVGDGPYKKTIVQQAAQLGVSSHIIFAGWVKDRKKIDALLSSHALALAPYSPDGKKTSNFTYYADPTKLKDYLSAGLPVITTNVPHNAHDIEKNRCGIVVSYSSDDIARAILSLMGNRKKLQTYQKHAREYARTFDWNTIFDHAVKTIKI